MRHQQCLQLGDPGLVDGGKRLIQQPQRALGQVQPGQVHPAVLAGGQRVTGHILITVKADPGQGVSICVRYTALPRYMPGQVLPRRQQRLHRRMMPQVTAAARADTRPQSRNGTAGQRYASGWSCRRHWALYLHQLPGVNLKGKLLEQLAPPRSRDRTSAASSGRRRAAGTRG